MNKSRKIQ